LTNPLPYDFRAFLRRHAELLRALPNWTLRLLVPRVRHAAITKYTEAFQEELATPVHPVVAEELRWFFRHADAAPAYENGRLQRARRAFHAPRFRALRRAWILDGDRAIDVAISTSLTEAIARGDGRFECGELARPYFAFAPLVS